MKSTARIAVDSLPSDVTADIHKKNVKVGSYMRL